jgi:hypothetical protein
VRACARLISALLQAYANQLATSGAAEAQGVQAQLDVFRDRLDDLLGARCGDVADCGDRRLTGARAHSASQRQSSWFGLGSVIKSSTGLVNKFAAMLVSSDAAAANAHAAPVARTVSEVGRSSCCVDWCDRMCVSVHRTRHH